MKEVFLKLRKQDIQQYYYYFWAFFNWPVFPEYWG